MAGTKTDFKNGTIVTPEFLDTIYKTNGGHNHKGLDEDGSANKLDIITETSGTIPITRVPKHDHKATADDPASYPKLDISAETSGKLPTNRSGFPVGSMMLYAGAQLSANDGEWLLCYGQPLSRTEYSVLFANIGTTFGTGDGSTTFNIPDMRGKFPAGACDTPYNAGELLGTRDKGENYVTLTINQIPPHKHQILGNDLTGGNTAQSFRRTNGDVESNGETESAGGNTGGTEAHENRPPFVALNFIIRVK